MSLTNGLPLLYMVEKKLIRSCPDFLFTDMIMPGGMNGRDLAEHLRPRLPGLTVLYFSPTGISAQ